MANTTPPMPDFPPPAPSATPKKPRTNAIIIGAAAAVIAAIVGTGIVVVQAQDDDSKPTATAESSAPAEAPATTVAEEPEPEPEPSYADVGPDSFTIELRTTDRQCFGSAGCNMTVEPKLSYVGASTDIDPEAVYEITYEIRGGDSGAVIETAELSDQTTLNFTPTILSTASSGTKLSVKITDVVSQGV
ncbi:hypothetical protein GCM10010330_57010 [Streptomyces tendae]|uniref:hypothetical protein n=1 Tax=Streptomyces tendae TaxID=1932 RepID=UPI001675D70D|nr:hypothetical protein [Streptomyces tendae]GHA95448.1 hypothetical protein GCM10010330_57010 [Streptomyces tendae]